MNCVLVCDYCDSFCLLVDTKQNLLVSFHNLLGFIFTILFSFSIYLRAYLDAFRHKTNKRKMYFPSIKISYFLITFACCKTFFGNGVFLRLPYVRMCDDDDDGSAVGLSSGAGVVPTAEEAATAHSLPTTK